MGSSDGNPTSARHVGRTVVTLAALGVAVLVSLVVVPGSGTPPDDGAEAAAEADATAAADAPASSTTTPPTSTPTTPWTTATTVPVGPTGAYLVAPGGSAPIGTGPLTTYRVEVEAATGVDPVGFASVVDAALHEPRSWTADGAVSLQRVAEGGDLRVVLATPATVDQLCAPLQTNGRFSCQQGGDVVINLERWLWAVDHWPAGLDAYRLMVVNHEVGHALGHDHTACPAQGAPAPVMQQQTKALEGCAANPWPFP